MAYPFFQEECAPCSVGPFVVDGARVVVKKRSEREDFGEGFPYDVKEGFTGDAVELIR